MLKSSIKTNLELDSTGDNTQASAVIEEQGSAVLKISASLSEELSLGSAIWKDKVSGSQSESLVTSLKSR